jgi:autotransporter-associated beta strand protein/T5SS/PEP-CTERM-associated repeat protein
VSGSGNFTKTGTGTLTLGGAANNSLSGTLFVNEGVVLLNKTAGLHALDTLLTVGDGAGGAGADVVRWLASNQINSGGGTEITVNSSGLLDLNGFSDVIKLDTLNGGAVNLNGGTLTMAGQLTVPLTATTTGTISNGTLGLGANRDFIVNKGSAEVDLEVSANITGAAELDKKGAGVLVLGGNNTFDGGMKLSLGALGIGHNSALGSGLFTITAGEVFGSGGTRTVTNTLLLNGDFSVGGTNDLTFTGNSTTSADRTYTITNTGVTTFAGSVGSDKVLYKEGSGKMVLASTNVLKEVYVRAGVLNIQHAGALSDVGQETYVSNLAALEIQGNIAVGAEPLFLGGAGAGTNGALRSVSGTNSWGGAITLQSAATLGADAGLLILSNTVANGGFTLTVNGPGNITATNVISGTGALVKHDAGILSLFATNTFSGGLTIHGGTVRINNTNSLGATVAGVTLNAATIHVLATFTNTRPFTLGAATSTFDVDPSQTYTLNGILSGTGGLMKAGTGTLTLGGTTNNSFTNLTIVNAGLLQLNKTAGLNAIGGSLTVGDASGGAGADVARLMTSNQIPDNATVSVLSSGLFDLNGFNETIDALNMTGGSVTSGTGTLVLGGNVTGNADAATATISGNLNLGGATRSFTIADGAAAEDMKITAVITNGGLLKLGGGQLVLAATNAFTGGVTVSNGTLVATVNKALGPGSGAVTVASGGTLAFSNTVAYATAQPVTIHGDGTGNAGALRNLSGNNSFAGPVTLGSAAAIGSDAGTLTLSGNVTNGGFTLTATGAGDLALTGVLSGAGGLTKSGAGTATLSGANTFTGTVIVSNGVLRLSRGTADNSAIPTDGVAGNTDITINGGTLQIAASQQIGNNGGIVLNTGAFNFSGSGLTETIGTFQNLGGTFTSGANTLVGSGSSITWAGGTNAISADGTVQDAHWVITGGTNTVQGQGGGATGGTLHVLTGGLGLEFGGTNNPTLTLDSDAGAAGRILLEGDVTVLGTLTTGTAQILNGGAAANGGFIDLNGGTRTFNVGDGSSLTDLVINVTLTNGALVKSGAGTLALGTNNAYTGPTTVNAGTLATAGTNALGGTTNLLIQTGGIVANTSGNTAGAGVFDGFASNRVATVTGAGSLWSNSSALYVGTFGTGNRLILTNGGVVVSAGGALGNASSSSGNTALVTGSGSVWSNLGTFYVGISGPGNALTITNGGVVTSSGSGHIGFINSASNNTAVVVGAGSSFSLTNDLFVGNAAAGNRLVISNGAQVANRTAQIGASLNASNNLVVVTGTNSLWINRSNLIVGGAGSANQLLITNAAAVTVGGSLIVGSSTNSSGNLATLGNGTLTVTNAAGAGALDVRRGTFGFNGGTINADLLLLTNGASSGFTFNDGTLTTRGTQATNGSAFVVGNGTAGAVFHLAGTNWHSFNNGLTVNTNARAILSNGNLTSATGVSVTAGGALELTGGITVNATPLTLNGTGIAGAGALRNTSGNNAYAGDVTLGSAATVTADTGTMTLSGAVNNNGHTLTVSGAGNTTISGAIGGAGGLTKTGAGTATLAGNNTFTGPLRVNQGTLQLGASDRIANSANVELNGGTFHTGGFNETLGTMTLGASSIIDFGSGTSTLVFADSSALTWTGTLEIHNWSGDAYGGGTDRLFFGNAATGLTADQLARIVWKNPFGMGDVTASVIYANGEVVPVPEPGTIAAVLGLIGFVGWRERRRISALAKKVQTVGGGMRIAKKPAIDSEVVQGMKQGFHNKVDFEEE